MLNLKENVVIFGPWTGEFSYEMNWWCPQLRRLKREQFSDYHTIAFSYTGRYGLYRDFIDEFIGYDKETTLGLGYPNCGVSSNIDNNTFYNYGDGDPAAYKFVQQYLSDVNNYPRVCSNNIHEFTGDKYGLDDYRSTFGQNPWGDYVHLDARPHIQERISKQIRENLRPDKDTIAVMARTRKKIDRDDLENWNPELWEVFIHKLIEGLGVNVVLIGVPYRHKDGYPGALDFENMPGKLYSMISEGEDAVEEQISILKNTKCSIYGASGAAFLTFFTNTPSFIFSQSKDSGRLYNEWCQKLTNKHENVKVYDTIDPGDTYYNADPNILFDEFKSFYEGLQ